MTISSVLSPTPSYPVRAPRRAEATAAPAGPADAVSLSAGPAEVPKARSLAATGQATAEAAAGAPLRMLLIGPPGSGKGTQANIVKRFFHPDHISTGQILRDNIAQGTELGKQAEPYVKQGVLVPDSIMLPMVDKRLEETDSFVLDGFPRSKAQAEHLDATLARLGKPLTCVSNLDVSDATVTKRLLERGRPDDTPEIIAERLRIYHDQTEPVIAHYQAQGLLDQIPAEGKVPEVGYNLILSLNRRQRED